MRRRGVVELHIDDRFGAHMLDQGDLSGERTFAGPGNLQRVGPNADKDVLLASGQRGKVRRQWKRPFADSKRSPFDTALDEVHRRRANEPRYERIGRIQVDLPWSAVLLYQAVTNKIVHGAHGHRLVW